MTLTLTASVEADHSPPRVRLDVTDSTGLISSVTISRLDPDSRYRKVRTSDDQPLPLSGGAATVYDYEAPFGSILTYTTDQTDSPTATATVDVGDVWLIHLGVPSRSMLIPTVVDLGSRGRALDQGVFQVLERSDPVVTTSGARLDPAGSLVIRTYTLTEMAALELLLSDGSPLLLNLPPSLGWGIGTSYVAIGDVEENRVIDYGPHPWREWTLPYQTIGRPAGGTQAAITWNDVATPGADDYTAAAGSQYMTWKEVNQALDSWAELSAPTS